MHGLVTISHWIDVGVSRLGKFGAWASVPCILFILIDVITRKFGIPLPDALSSTRMQEWQWHFHTILFCMGFGFAYLADAHVRIDLVREKVSERTKQWIELIGCLAFLMPYLALLIYFGTQFTYTSFEQGEGSSALTGLSHRWAIKIFMPIGFTLLFLAGLAVLCRKIVELFGPEDLRREVLAEEEAEHVDLEGLESTSAAAAHPHSRPGE